jgi:hypothetical protein
VWLIWSLQLLAGVFGNSEIACVQRVMLLLRCWKVLVPLKMEVDYESACSAPEKLIVQPEVIEWHHRSLDATPDGEQGGRQVAVRWVNFSETFVPPGTIQTMLTIAANKHWPMNQLTSPMLSCMAISKNMCSASSRLGLWTNPCVTQCALCPSPYMVQSLCAVRCLNWLTVHPVGLLEDPLYQSDYKTQVI